jgi:penicillin-binding protein 2B
MNRKRPGMNIGAAILFGIFGLLFFVLIVRIITIQVTGEAEGRAVAAQAAKKYIKTGVLEAKRGTIFDSSGDPIAEDTASFSLVAILSPTVTGDPDEPKHVVDPKKTAKKLSKHIDMSESEIYEQLTPEKEPFQVEFGNAGRDISQQVKKAIEKENLPGITFIQESKRFYPNGVFSSHLIGFAQKKMLENGDSVTNGMMGIEKSFNDILQGEDGKLQYKSDVWGYLLPDAEEHVTPPKDGHNIHLTIDKKIQTFLEDALSSVEKQYNPKKMIAVVADPKTGEILAMGQRPTFHPDSREGLDQNWHNEIVETTFEPGSTFKTFSLAAAVEEGVFNPNASFESGTYKVDKVPHPIRDWNNGNGWGTISYLEGVQRSSNVLFANLLDKIGQERFKDYLDAFHFGKPTNVGLPNEASGKILYNYPVERITTIFGQGTTVSALQMIQAETAIANDGKMMKPYVISKIVDPNKDKIVKQTKPEVVGNPISKETAKKVRKYLASTVTSEHGTGQPFAIDGYDVAGKSGTAQIPDPDGGGYLNSGKEGYLFSFLGMAPADNPQLIVYVAIEQPELKPTEIGSDPVSKVFNPVMQNSLKYLNIKPDEKIGLKKVKVPDVTGENIQNAKAKFKELGLKPIVLGNGTRVEKQSPLTGEMVLAGERIILKTDGDITIPDMKGWSVRDVLKVSNVADLKLNMVGSGYVVSQNVKPDSPIQKGEPLVVNFQTPKEQLNKEEVEEGGDEEQPLN